MDVQQDVGDLGSPAPERDTQALESIVRERFAKLDTIERAVLAEVLRLEHDKLHLVQPRGIKQDIADVVRRLVK